MVDKIIGEKPSEVYHEFEELFKDEDLVFSPFSPLQLGDGIPLEKLDFQRVEGKDKFYRVVAEDGGYDIAVRVDLVEGSYEITQVRTIEGNGSLSDYLEDYFQVN